MASEKKVKFRLFLYPFSEIAAGKVPVWAKIKTSPMRFWKKGNKNPPDFFPEDALVPGAR